MNNQKFIHIISFFFTFILVGCNGKQIITYQNSPPIDATTPTIVSITSTNRPTLRTATRTTIPLKQSVTPSQTLPVTNTPAVSVTLLPPSLTPLPTLSPNQAQEMVLNLLKNNADCVLPCWWGITPGKTLWQNAYHFLSSFAERIDQGSINASTIFEVYNTIPGYRDSIASSYIMTDGIVEKISVLPRGTELRYQLYQVLTEYGMPDDVLLFMSDVSPAGSPWFYFYIFYVEKGFTVIFNGEAQLDNNIFQICPDGLGPKLILIPPGSKDLYWMKRDAYDVPFQIPSINDFPGKSIESFYETMKIAGSCLKFDPDITK
jgi:hypothetical protein